MLSTRGWLCQLRNWWQLLPDVVPSSRAEAACALVQTARTALPEWFDKCVRDTLVASGLSVDWKKVDSLIANMVAKATPEVLSELELSVSGQRADNPLQVFRRAVKYPTAVLECLSVQPVHRDEFAVRSFPGDLFGLSPATWIDISESLHEPGIIWGAWTAREALTRE